MLKKIFERVQFNLDGTELFIQFLGSSRVHPFQYVFEVC